jgi:HSP20 family protein
MGKGYMGASDDLDRAQAEMDRLYQEMVAPGRWVVVRHAHAWRPPTDVYETGENVVVRVEVAGMKEADFSVSLADRVLVVAGVRHDPSPKVAYHQMEIRYGEFRTEVYLHWAVETSSIEAVYTDGFLQITLPKTHPQRVHVVEATDTNAES